MIEQLNIPVRPAALPAAEIDDIMDRVQLFGDAMCVRVRMAGNGSDAEYATAYAETKRLKDDVRNAISAIAQPTQQADHAYAEGRKDEREHLLALIAALAAIVEFCDDPNGSGNGESLAMGLARLLPAARAALAKAST